MRLEFKPYPNEHSARVRDPKDFIEDSFRRKNIDDGVDIIIGKLKGGDGSMVVQAYRFDASKFTAEEAKKWLKDHDVKYIDFEPAKEKQSSKLMELKIYNSRIEDVDETKGIIINYDSAFNKLDSDGDIIRPGAFSKTLKENVKRMKWFLNHNPNLLLGVPFIEGTKQDDFGLLSYNKINLDKEIGRDTLADYRLFKEYGRTLEHSIGYEVLNYKPLEMEGKSGREIYEIKLWEKSTLTHWGANEHTPLVDMKSMLNMSLEEWLMMLEDMLDRKYSDERKWAVEKILNIVSKYRSPEDDQPPAGTDALRPTFEEVKKIIVESFKIQ